MHNTCISTSFDGFDFSYFNGAQVGWRFSPTFVCAGFSWRLQGNRGNLLDVRHSQSLMLANRCHQLFIATQRKLLARAQKRDRQPEPLCVSTTVL
jgi:hypothetical protein